jgi:septal ring-binding cell division protein DamX
MRDMNRVRDKIEIRLEPRQIAILVVGTLLFSAALFAGGYHLGSRTVVDTVAVADLSTIDAAAAEVLPAIEATPPTPAALGEVEFLFPSLLGSRPARKAKVRKPVQVAPPVAKPKKTVASVARKPVPPEPVVVTPKPVYVPEPVVAAPEPVVAPKPVVLAPAPVVLAPEPVFVPEPVVAPKPVFVPEPVVVAPKPLPEPVVPEPAAKPAPPVIVLSAAPKRAVDEDAPSVEPVASKTKFTLQVKAARTRSEVDAFLATVRGKGFKPSVILANVPGKGRVYRVRIGRFTSRGEARRFQRDYKRRSGQPDGGFVTEL